MARLFKALSEEIRLRILMLLTHGELCVCDLMAIFDEPQSKISRHLAYLKHSGLVDGRRVGTWMHYSLRESLGEVSRAQIELLKAVASGRPVFDEDLARMNEVKEQKLCERGENPRRGRTKEDRRDGPRTVE